MSQVEQVAPRVFVESSSALPLVSFSVSVPLGAAEDPDGQLGLTRLLAILLRRTAGGRTAQQLDVAVDGLGASLAVDVTQSTLSLSGSVIARNLPGVVELLADAIARPGFDEDELERAKRETLAELVESRDDDRTLAQRWFRRRLFQGHPAGRSVSGTPATLAAIDRPALLAQHARLITREQLHFAFAGALTPAQAAEIAASVSGLAPSGEARSSLPQEPPPQPGRRLVVVDKPERTQTQILIGCLGTHPHDADHLPLLVGNTVFGGTFTARMTRAIRSDRGWSYGAYSSLPSDRYRQSFSMWTFPRAEDAAPCVALELELLERWVAEGISQQELELAQRFLVESHAFSVDTASKRVGLELEQQLHQLPPRYYHSYTERIEAVTLSEVNAAIARRITPEDLLVTVVGTNDRLGPELRRAVARLAEAEVIPYTRD